MSTKGKARSEQAPTSKAKDVPDLRQSPKNVIAILCSDLHLSLRPPLARRNEPDWFAAMERPLRQLAKLSVEYDACIVCAGDIFDRWNSPPELINWALLYLPEMYSVPGQHELPHHRMEDIHKSVYWTLVQAGRLKDLSKNGAVINCRRKSKGLHLVGFPWGAEIKPYSEFDDFWREDFLSLAVIHKFVWIKGHSYVGGEIGCNHLKAYGSQLEGYNAAVYGDNHLGFVSKVGDCSVMNCGGFMRRTIDQRNYKPMVGLLLADGSILPHYLDVSEDKFVETLTADDERTLYNFHEFMQELEKLEDNGLDFSSAVNRALRIHNPDPRVRKVLLKALEGALDGN